MGRRRGNASRGKRKAAGGGGRKKKPLSAKQKKKELQAQRARDRAKQERESNAQDYWAAAGFAEDDWAASDEDVSQYDKDVGNDALDLPLARARHRKRMSGNDGARAERRARRERDAVAAARAQSSAAASAASAPTIPGDLRTVFAKEPREAIELRKLYAQLPFLRRTHLRADKRFYETVVEMPVRPEWDYGMSKRELEQSERSYFEEYITDLYERFGADRLNYFEHNLEVWRQLWRTCEKSDILLVVADVRHPLFNFPPSLYRYVVHTLRKPLVLVLNKIDMISTATLERWIDYFMQQYPELHIVPFTSFPMDESITSEGFDPTKKRPRIVRRGKYPAGATFLLDACKSILQQTQENAKLVGGGKGSSSLLNVEVELDALSLDSRFLKSKHLKRATRVKEEQDELLQSRLGSVFGESGTAGAADPAAPSAGQAEDAVSEVDDEEAVEARGSESDDEHDSEEEENVYHASDAESGDDEEEEPVVKFAGPPGGPSWGEDDSGDEEDGEDGEEEEEEEEEEDEEEEQERQRHEDARSAYRARRARKKRKFVTLGFLGHPNAGKSSVINALTCKKVVSVSKSPGHTKHFQTLFLNDSVRLCDCPGLVFPAVDMPKSLQILCGLYPIAQVREPYSCVQFLAERIPLEEVYNLKPVHSAEDVRQQAESLREQLSASGKLPASDCEDAAAAELPYPWTAWAICESYATKKNYRTKKGGLDEHRAGNELLRHAHEGRVVLYFEPPTVA